jgi:hypothetical protein
MAAWSVGLQMAVSAYAAENRLDIEAFLPVDLVLVLLRIRHAEAHGAIAELTGRPITRCPSGMPPWPPKPPASPATRPVEPKVSMVVPNPCPPSTDMHRRFDLVKKGLTREQLIARGCQVRDIRYWQNKGHLRFG